MLAYRGCMFLEFPLLGVASAPFFGGGHGCALVIRFCYVLAVVAYMKLRKSQAAGAGARCTSTDLDS
jgi:hypothetical protein